MSHTVSLDGMEITVYRGDHGRLVVDIDTSELGPDDVFEDEIPNIRIWINEQLIRIGTKGELIED